MAIRHANPTAISTNVVAPPDEHDPIPPPGNAIQQPLPRTHCNTACPGHELGRENFSGTDGGALPPGHETPGHAPTSIVTGNELIADVQYVGVGELGGGRVPCGYTLHDKLPIAYRFGSSNTTSVALHDPLPVWPPTFQ